MGLVQVNQRITLDKIKNSIKKDMELLDYTYSDKVGNENQTLSNQDFVKCRCNTCHRVQVIPVNYFNNTNGSCPVCELLRIQAKQQERAQSKNGQCNTLLSQILSVKPKSFLQQGLFFNSKQEYQKGDDYENAVCRVENVISINGRLHVQVQVHGWIPKQILNKEMPKLAQLTNSTAVSIPNNGEYEYTVSIPIQKFLMEIKRADGALKSYILPYRSLGKMVLTSLLPVEDAKTFYSIAKQKYGIDPFEAIIPRVGFTLLSSGLSIVQPHPKKEYTSICVCNKCKQKIEHQNYKFVKMQRLNCYTCKQEAVLDKMTSSINSNDKISEELLKEQGLVNQVLFKAINWYYGHLMMVTRVYRDNNIDTGDNLRCTLFVCDGFTFREGYIINDVEFNRLNDVEYLKTIHQPYAGETLKVLNVGSSIDPVTIQVAKQNPSILYYLCKKYSGEYDRLLYKNYITRLFQNVLSYKFDSLQHIQSYQVGRITLSGQLISTPRTSNSPLYIEYGQYNQIQFHIQSKSTNTDAILICRLLPSGRQWLLVPESEEKSLISLGETFWKYYQIPEDLVKKLFKVWFHR